MRGRDTNFLISDADSSADDVRIKAEEYADPESRVSFYDRVMTEVAGLRATEQGKIKYD